MHFLKLMNSLSIQKKWLSLIEERLKTLSENRSADFFKSEFNAKLLSVLESLVEFGFYWNLTSNDEIDHLVKLLDYPVDKAKCILV